MMKLTKTTNLTSLTNQSRAKRGLLLSATATLLTLISSNALAVSTSASYPDTGKLAHSTPVTTTTFSTSFTGGGRYISQQANILPKTTQPAKTSTEAFELANKKWTYTRGVGTMPVCKEGYERAGFLCKVEGASFFSKQIPMECPDGKVKDAGLCYKPCADSFKGYGPFCSGNLAALKPQDLSEDVAKQHAAALSKFNQPGIKFKETEIPRIKTDTSFGPTICKLAPAFEVGNKVFDEASSFLIGKIGKAIKGDADLSIKNSSGDTLWSVPSLNKFVAYDLSAKPTCTEEADKYVAKLDIDNSVTVKASTKMFDSLFDNLGGVDAGIAKVSIYELIPFRVYGSTGVTLGANYNVESTTLKDKPPFLVNNVPHAHQTALNVTPSLNLWLGLDGYVRITSIIKALPDVVQVGGDVDLDVVKWQLPYALKEGVTYADGTRKLFIDETLDSTFSAGSGQAKPFLKVFGQKIKVFKETDTKKWTGHQETENLLTRKGTY